MSIDDIKNIKYFESFSNFKASRPNISLIFGLAVPFPFGGVLGKLKLNKPSVTDTIDAK